jgi:6-phosphogluconolactonase
MNKQVKVFKDTEELNNFAAEKFVEIANEAIKQRRRFNVALAGGSTPKSLYQLLASEKYENKIDWAKVYFFFGDERHVLPDDAESNFRMANENLFTPLHIPADRIHWWDTTHKDGEKIAESYNETMTYFFGLDEEVRLPEFDLILLGMGADGHTASLFPFTKALHETEKSAVANYVEKLNDWRFTLTFPVINNARNVIFLVAGEEKAETLQSVLEGEFQPDKFPAQNVRPEHGELYWLLDENVAKLLKNDRN